MARSNVVKLPERQKGIWRALLARVSALGRRSEMLRRPNPFAPAQPFPGVVGEGRPKVPQLAMDAADHWKMALDQGEFVPGADWGWMGAGVGSYAWSAYAEGQEWLGYSVLALLFQRVEYRVMVETVATEMTREWIVFKSKSDDKNQQARIEKIEERLDDLKLRAIMKAANVNDGSQGRGQVYIDTGEPENRDELKLPLGNAKQVRAKYGRGKFIKRLSAIEPMWCYPAMYEASDPLKSDWYRPNTWWVMGKEVHRDRLLTFVGNAVPDLLKPAYSFGGLATTQMAKPYVDFWLRNRTSESNLLNNFSLRVLATDLDVSTADEGSELFQRALALNTFADNQGVLLINKASEDFNIRQTSLGGIAEITRQSMERMTIPSRMPIVKFFGNQPSGLNADSEGVIRMWYDDIRAAQQSRNREVIQRIVELVEIELFGEIIDDILWEFKDLWQLDEAGKMAVQLTKAQIVETDISSGVIDPEEGRLARAKDEDSPYVGMDLEAREAPGEEIEAEQEEAGGVGAGASGGPYAPKPQGETAKRLARSVGEQAAEFGGAETGGLPAKDGYNAADTWHEADHPRGQPGNAGQFAASPGGGKSSPQSLEPRSGGQVPPHIAKLRVPPAWSGVRFNDDPEAALWVTGRDAKGREQRIYNPDFSKSQAEAKYRRIEELDRRFAAIKDENEAARVDPRRRDAADVLALIIATGVRPGGERETGAEKRAYGATTLEGRHVRTDADGRVRLVFVGKKGVDLDLPVHDADVARMLLERKAAAGDNGRLFDVTADRLREYVHSLDGGSFKTKDFRTLLGTRTAMQEMANVPAPSSPTAYRRAVMTVAKGVARRLGNTPTVALQSYIAPEVFGSWRMAAGV